MRKMIFLFAVITGLMSCQKSLDNFTIKSPDEQVELNISVVDSALHYKINWEGNVVLETSELEMFPNSTVQIISATEVENDEEWNTVWGQFSKIRNHYKELTLELEYKQVKGKLLARAYDQGIAFRFILDEGAKPEDADLYCSYALPEGSSFYAPAGENEPLGPLSLNALNEHLATGGKNGRNSMLKIPLVVETPNHQFLALLESDLYAAEGFQMMDLGVDLEKGIVSSNPVKTGQEELVTPWRTILLGNSAGELLTNTMTENLATPCKLEDTDWIKPGMTMWDWRVHGFTTEDGFTYGINTESYLRFIDFAAEKGIEYFLIDAAWYSGHDESHFEVNKHLNMPEVMEYASGKNVGIILYYDRRGGDFGDEKLFPYFQSLGAKGIKYGFMGTGLPFTKDAIRMSAENHLLIDFHDGPLPFAGIHRTFPNAVTREYCHAQQDSRRAFTPEAFIKMAHINALTGPLDMNNGNFDITGIKSGQRQKGPRIQNSYFSTVASEAARTLIIFSGLVCIPDAPEAYEAKKDLFEFIQKQPVGKWDESRILNSKIDGYITTARRHRKEWFIGSVINQEGGSLDIKLDFLDEDQVYDVTFYEDTEKTHCKTNPEAYKVRKGNVKKDDIIKAVLAPGGGHCMWIRPKEIENINLPISVGLILDLNADTGLTIEEDSMVISWTNQAPSPKAIDFKITEEGRTKTIVTQEEQGTGRPTLSKNISQINGHNSLIFREDELINENDEAFHGMMTGSGYTWFAVIKPYEQGGPGKINSRYPNAFFGCLRNSGPPQKETGQYAGFWGSFYPDGRVYMGSRNGLNEKVRDGVNTPEVEGPPPSINEWHIIMGRQGSGKGVVLLELFVDDPSDAINSSDFPVGDVEPSRMAIGTERNAINHQGKESFDGELARLLMFETALNEKEMKEVYEYLRKFYFR